MSESVIIENVTCSKCGSHLFLKSQLEKGIYICDNDDPSSPIGKCWAVHVLCKTCNKIYPEENFGLHGDVYECKECGTTNWPYTDRKRSSADLMKKIGSLNSSLDSFLSRNKDIFG